MKLFLTCALAALTASVLAQTPAPNAQMFAQAKQMSLQHIAARMNILQNLQSCVQSANDGAALRACHQTAKAAKQQLKASAQSDRQGLRAERQSMKAQRRAGKTPAQ